MNKIPTNFGEVEVDELVRIYNIYKRRDAKNQNRRKQVLSTEAGREKNRERSRSYYHRNKDIVLEKRKQEYQKKKNDQSTE